MHAVSAEKKLQISECLWWPVAEVWASKSRAEGKLCIFLDYCH